MEELGRARGWSWWRSCLSVPVSRVVEDGRNRKAALLELLLLPYLDTPSSIIVLIMKMFLIIAITTIHCV
jgi:hypothetical protein